MLYAGAAYGISIIYNGPGQALILLPLIVGALFLWLAFLALPATAWGKLSLAKGYLPTFMAAWLVSLLASTFWSTFPQISWYLVWSIAAIPLLFLLWLYQPPSEALWRRLLTILCVLTALAAIWGIAAYVITVRRTHGPFHDFNAYGALLNLFFFAALLPYLRLQARNPDEEERNPGEVVETGPKPSRISLRFIRATGVHFWRLRALETFFALLLLALFATYSRGAVGCFLILLPVALFLARRHHGRILRGTLIVVCIAVASYAAVKIYPAHTITRNLDLADDNSFQSRVMMWQSMLHIYRDHPWLGTGIGTYKLFYPAYRNPHETSSSGDLGHQDYLQFLQEQGPIGLAFLLICGLAVLWLGWRLDARARSDDNSDASHCIDALGLLIGVAALFGQAMVNFIFYIPALSIPVGLFMSRAYTLVGERHFRRITINARPAVLKFAVIVVLGLPVAGLLADGIISGVLLKQDKLPIASAIRADDHRLYRFAALAQTLRPRNALPYVTLGYFDLKSATQQGLPAFLRARFAMDACQDYLKLLWLNPRSSEALGGLAAVLDAYPALADSLPGGVARDPDVLLQQAIRYDPLYLPAYQLLAARYAARGEKRKALNLLADKAVFWYSIPADDHDNRVRVLEQAINIAQDLHDAAAVRALSRNLLANDPGNKLAKLVLAERTGDSGE